MANDDVILKLSADVSDINGKLARVTSQFVSLEKTVSRTSGKISGQLTGLGRLFKLGGDQRRQPWDLRVVGLMSKIGVVGQHTRTGETRGADITLARHA